MPQKKAVQDRWPREYPAVVKQPVNPPAAGINAGWLAIKVGDEVKCISSIKESAQGPIVQIQYPKNDNGSPGRYGWTKVSVLKIGDKTGPIIGDPLSVQLGPPRYLRVHDDVLNSVDLKQGLLYSTVLALLTTWYENLDDLPKTPEYLRKNHVNTAERRQAMAASFCESIKAVNPKLLELLNTGNFTGRQLYGLAAKITPTSQYSPHGKKTGVYNCVARDFRDRPDKGPAIYVGQTARSFSVRFDEHRESATAKRAKGVLYRTAKGADTLEMYAMSFVHSVATDWQGELLRIFEQLWVELLETSSHVVRNLNTVSETLDDNEGDEKTIEGDTLTRVAKYAIDKDSALVFENLSKQVFAKTGWPGGCRTNAQFGITTGLNWSMPLSERAYSKTTWTMIEKPGRFAEFRRTGCFVSEADGQKSFFFLTAPDRYNDSAARYTTHFFFGPSRGPPVGTSCDVVFELTLDGSRHPIPHGMQPTIGAMSDFAEAGEIGMRAEWRDPGTGVWKYEYIQMPSAYNRKSEGHPTSVPEGYIRATGLRAFFLQEVRKPTREFPFIRNYGIARIKKIKIDHLTQSVRSEFLLGRHERPANKSLHWVTPVQQQNQLRALGAVHTPNPDVVPTGTTGAQPYPPVPNTWRPGNFKPKFCRCDFCYFGCKIGGHNWSGLKCIPVEGKSVCDSCQRMGRGCCYTPAAVMNASKALQEASFNPVHVNADPNAAPKDVVVRQMVTY